MTSSPASPSPPSSQSAPAPNEGDQFQLRALSLLEIQILTIQDLLDGRRPEMPWLDPTAFRKARREDASTQGTLI